MGSVEKMLISPFLAVPGSGKTTLLNALSALIPPGERIVTIEDSAELRFDEHPHVVRLEARQKTLRGSAKYRFAIWSLTLCACALTVSLLANAEVRRLWI